MGDRSMIVVKAEKFVTPIAFYGHWSGEQNIEAVKNVLARTGRIGDVAYLTAQLFWEFAQLGQYDGELSFGIDAYADTDDFWMDNPSVIVNADTGEYEVNGEVFTEFAKTKI